MIRLPGSRRPRPAPVAAACLVVASILLGATPAGAQIPDPCKLLTKAEASAILGKRVVSVTHRRDAANKAARCTWVTRFYQTPRFKRLHAPFSLKLDTQAKSAAANDLEQLRTRAAEVGETTVEKVDGLGDEAFRNFSDLIVVSGNTAIVAAVSNYDTSKKPYPDVDGMARKAADRVLPRLATAPKL